jgi:predicted enzyme related to lactoylglutathione lyase
MPPERRRGLDHHGRVRVEAELEKFRDEVLMPHVQAGIQRGFPIPPQGTEIDVSTLALAETIDKEGMDMVANNRISAVLVSTDLERSQSFYETKVGLTLSPETIKNHLLFECGDGTTLLIYGRGSGNKADHTQVRFWSTDIDKDVSVLAANGIEFEEYDTETFKTVDHIVTSPGIGRSAWFKDPDGNTIAVFQPE